MEVNIKRKTFTYGLAAVLLALILGFVCYNFGVQLENAETGGQHQPSPTVQFPFMSLARVFTSGYHELKMEGIEAPQYELPINLENVVNFDRIMKVFNPDSSALQKLSENGFVVIPSPIMVDTPLVEFDEYYSYLDEIGIPIFVTSDSILHVYHVFFDEILRSIEEQYFVKNLTDMTNDLVRKSTELYQQIQEEGILKEAAKRNVAFFCVAAKLLNSSFQIPDFVSDLVNSELELIEAHKGPEPSFLFSYIEDYSQFVPRGHYTRSEKLQEYFKAMMWYGRMRFMANSIDDPDLWKLQTIQASLIAYQMVNEVENRTRENWEKIYTTTAFFTGYSDDLTVYDYWNAILQVYGKNFSIYNLEDEEKLGELQQKIFEINHSKIISSPIFPYQRPEVVGLRFMGQRFVPDSYIFQELVFDKVGGRLLPKGLDVMAVLGSERAEKHLEKDKTQYPGYAEQLNKLKNEFSQLTVQNWTQNLYWTWLFSIKSTLEQPTENYPTFMKTEAWLDEKLNTALGSWTELRHDTILYAKQSYTLLGIPPEVPPGYVEPIPELYHRLTLLSNMTLNGLEALNLKNQTWRDKLLEFQELLIFLKNVSLKELRGESLSQEEIDQICKIGMKLSSILKAFSKDSQKSTLIADVHTDPITSSVLEEACGYIETVIVVYKASDGRLIAAAGPVFSYYEFAQPNYERLTDEEWMEILKAGEAPPRPEWIESFHA